MFEMYYFHGLKTMTFKGQVEDIMTFKCQVADIIFCLAVMEIIQSFDPV